MDDQMWNQETFFPVGDCSNLDALLEKVYKKREVEFIALCLRLVSSEAKICEETGFVRYFDSLRTADTAERRNLVSDPNYYAWFKQTVRAHSDQSILRKRLNDFGRVLELVSKGQTGKKTILVNGQTVILERFGVDSLITDLAEPEYRIPDKKRQTSVYPELEYPESFFMTSFELAMRRIEHAWVEAYNYFPKFVKIVVDMIDGRYTSYSSADHTGAIFVSTDNSPLVALEEFIIHEFGHQILYHVMEIDPIVTGEDVTIYRLPWSGNERDLYGYFHAFYIYVFMAKYLERVRDRSAREQNRIIKRRRHILDGLEESIEIFEQSGDFTQPGQLLFQSLRKEIVKLSDNVERN